MKSSRQPPVHLYASIAPRKIQKQPFRPRHNSAPQHRHGRQSAESERAALLDTSRKRQPVSSSSLSTWPNGSLAPSTAGQNFTISALASTRSRATAAPGWWGPVLMANEGRTQRRELIGCFAEPIRVNRAGRSRNLHDGLVERNLAVEGRCRVHGPGATHHRCFSCRPGAQFHDQRNRGVSPGATGKPPKMSVVWVTAGRAAI